MSENPQNPEGHVSESKPAGAETGKSSEPHAAPAHEAHAGQGHEGPTVKTYLVIFGALSVFTAVSFIANYFAHAGVITPFTSFAIILSVAVCKATLVGMYFMHLILDWNKVFVMIVPALVLGPMLMIVLLPDIVMAWKNVLVP